MAKGSMREQMPVVTALIDDLRATFGKEMIDGQIRKGINGQPTFWATENGFTVGTKMPTARKITGSGE
jgi:hypothetical protein